MTSVSSIDSSMVGQPVFKNGRVYIRLGLPEDEDNDSVEASTRSLLVDDRKRLDPHGCVVNCREICFLRRNHVVNGVFSELSLIAKRRAIVVIGWCWAEMVKQYISSDIP